MIRAEPSGRYKKIIFCVPSSAFAMLHRSTLGLFDRSKHVDRTVVAAISSNWLVNASAPCKHCLFGILGVRFNGMQNLSPANVHRECQVHMFHPFRPLPFVGLSDARRGTKHNNGILILFNCSTWIIISCVNFHECMFSLPSHSLAVRNSFLFLWNNKSKTAAKEFHNSVACSLFCACSFFSPIPFVLLCVSSVFADRKIIFRSR